MQRMMLKGNSLVPLEVEQTRVEENEEIAEIAALPDEEPNAEWTKKQLFVWCEDHGIPITPARPKAFILNEIDKFNAFLEQPELPKEEPIEEPLESDESEE